MNLSSCPPLSKILAQSFITVVNWCSQMCLFLNACCLSKRSSYSSRWAMIFEHTMCSSNLQGTQSERWNDSYLGDPIDVKYICKRPFLGISAVSNDCWKRCAKTGPSPVTSSFRTLGWSPSGPKALEGFKTLRSLVPPSFETTMLFMKGAYLLRNGTSHWTHP